jgi:DNA primase
MPAKAAQHEKLAQPATAQTWQEYFGQARPANGTAAIQYLMQRGIPDTITESAGARFLSIRGRDFVVFPFCNLAGAPVAFQARALDSKANPHRAYGRKRAGVFLTCADALQAETVIVCEAPIDAMSLAACGYPAIALGGTVMPEWLPKALAFKRILLAFDNDTNGAGDKAATDIKPALYSFGAKTARLAPQRMLDAPKSDWNTMLQASGVKALRAWLVCRLAHLEFLGSR